MGDGERMAIRGRLGRRVAMGGVALCVAAGAGLTAHGKSAPKPAAATATATKTKAVPVATCTGPVSGQELRPPDTIRPNAHGFLGSTLMVERKDLCVPFWSGNEWEWKVMNLRSYGRPINGNALTLQYGLPGPTYRVKKSYLETTAKPPGPDNKVTQVGSVMALKLVNNIQAPPGVKPSDYFHDPMQCVPSQITATNADDPSNCPAGKSPCTFPIPGPDQAAQACMHGAEVTNIHFHGTHASPQPYHDFVLLSLFSPFDPFAPKTLDEYNQVGAYQIRLDPFPWNQAPGTHWYHPHKHGSTAVQVGNGMAGPLLIQGEFDDWLYRLYGVNPNDSTSLDAFEKVMTVQVIAEDAFFFPGDPAQAANLPLVTGQASPVVTMHPGEVKRFRFIGATVSGHATANITFPSDVVVKQIAQDGVQFAPENYDRQPMWNPASGSTPASFTLSPGTRADFLVMAKPTQVPARLNVLFTRVLGGKLPRRAQDRVNRGLFGVDKKGVAKSTDTAAAAVAAASPPLFTIVVDDKPIAKPMPLPVTTLTDASCKANPSQPRCYPAMPYYLQDLKETPDVKRSLQFSMRDPVTKVCTQNGQPPNGFWINGVQFNDECANLTMNLGAVEEWTIANDSPLPHPFHIHTNPFQLVTWPGQPANYGKPYVWMDTRGLPVGASPAQGASDQCNTNVSLTLRQQYLDYTGPYVIHCHFLGHEDRGMMWAIQTVCGSKTPYFGLPLPIGPDNCSVVSPSPPLPACVDKAKPAAGK